MPSRKSGHLGHVLRRSATSALCSLSLLGGLAALPAKHGAYRRRCGDWRRCRGGAFDAAIDVVVAQFRR